MRLHKIDMFSDKKYLSAIRSDGSVHPLKKMQIYTQQQEIDVVAAFHAHPTTTIRQVASTYNLSKSTIQKIVKKNGLKP